MNCSYAITEDLHFFSKIKDYISKNYISPPNDKKLIEDAISGMVSGLDPYSEYFNEKSYKELKNVTLGEFIGIGAEGIRDSMLRIKDKEVNIANAEIINRSGLDIIVNIIPNNIFKSFVEGNILQVILFAFFCGIILNIKRDDCEKLIEISSQITQLLFKMIEVIMKVAPIGVFGYMAAMVGTEGLDTIISLINLVMAVFTGCVLQYLFFGIMILFFTKMSPIPFFKKMLGPQLIAFSTSSSKATLVPLMNVVENDLGVSKQSSRFLLPLSAALNMDGGAIYQAVSAIFFSQVLGIDLSWGDYATLALMCTIASIGGAGIPGGVLLFLGMVLNSVGMPIAGVILVASVDRILDMLTTVINITGDACVTLLIDNSEKTLNKEVYRKSKAA